MGKNDIPAGNHSDYKYDGLQGYAGRYPDSFKGLNTGTLTALLDESETPTFALSVVYYDYRGRPAQVNSGQRLTKEYYCYTFGGQVKHKKVMHAKSDKAPTLFDHYTYTYDHAQRLVKT